MMFAGFVLVMVIAYSTLGDAINCVSNDDCATDRLCVHQKCIDPCPAGVCGANSQCIVNDHIALCACEPGHAGHPFTGCYVAPAEDGCANAVGKVKIPTTQSPAVPKKKKKEFRLQTISGLNWFQALLYCRSLGLHLASIESQEEFDELVGMIRKANLGVADFWLSGSDLGEEGKFMWMSNGGPLTYTNWQDSEPNHRNHSGKIEHCLELSWGVNYKMNDDLCDKNKYLACEAFSKY